MGFVLLSTLCLDAQAQLFLSQEAGSKTHATLQSKHHTLPPGAETFLYLTLTHDEGWYSYYFNNSVPNTVRPTLEIKPVEGIEFGPLQYSQPEIKTSYGIPSYVYKGTSHFRLPIKVSSDLVKPQKVEISGSASWQVCKDSCLNENATLSTTFQIGTSSTIAKEIDWSEIEKTFPQAISDLSAEFTGDSILIHSDTPLQSAHFFDYDGQTQFGAPLVEISTSPTYTYQLPRDQGNDLRDTIVPIQPKIRGILTSQTGKSFWLEVPLENASQTPPTTASTPKQAKVDPQTSPLDLPSDKKLARLYNPERPITFETLKKTAPPSFWLAISGAFLGGILLNLMPCVFPVLSLKVLNFVEKSGADPWKVRLHGMLFTLGVMLSMWTLVIALFIFKASSGNSFSWGQQMGDPRFVGGIIITLFLFGLNMAGVFEFGTKLTSVGQTKETKNEYLATIFSGVLTTIIATPCSGPFLGAAMGYTFEQPLPVALLIFTVFSIGISLPYLLLSFFPQLTSRLPKPGAWMVTLKQLLSFGMFAAAAFFMQTFGAQVGATGLSLLTMALVIIGLASYCYGVWSLPYIQKAKRYIAGFILPLLILLSGLSLAWHSAHQKAPQAKNSSSSNQTVHWIAWRPGIVEHLRAQGKHVWVDYTATWCSTCLVNKKRIFSDDAFLERARQRNIVFVKADLTDNNPEVAKDLSRASRVQIPVNLVYPPDSATPTILLEELISPKQALKALDLTKS